MKNLRTYEGFVSGGSSNQINEFYKVKMNDDGIKPDKWTADIQLPEISIYGSDYDFILEELEESNQIPMEFTFDRICHDIASSLDSYVDSVLDQIGGNNRDYVDAWEYMDEEEKDKWYKRCEGRNPMLKKLSFARKKVI
jgi:hypothetical protein